MKILLTNNGKVTNTFTAVYTIKSMPPRIDIQRGKKIVCNKNINQLSVSHVTSISDHASFDP